MTLEDGIRKAAMLLDEYNSGSIDSEIEIRMPDLFDMAQKQIAGMQPIVREYTVPFVSGTTSYEMPDDFEQSIAVWNGDSKVTRQWRGRKIITSTAVTVEYIASPTTITPDTEETYEFEVSESAQQAMPYFVAGSLLATDLVQSPNNLLTMWQTMIAQIRTASHYQDRVRRVF